MKRRIITACTALLLGTGAWMPAAQAASFSSIQPYLTDYKYGFTDGAKLVSKPVYDEFSRYSNYTIVTKAGKQGILDNKTGKEITPAIWDNIQLPSPGKIAIVQKGGWSQYVDLTNGKLSAKFAGAHTYYLSAAHDTVINMVGQTSMLLDPSGKELIKPFAGKLSFVELVNPQDADNPDANPVRYPLASVGKQITLYDPATFAPKFTLKNAELIPNEGGPKTAYLKVRSGGKEGLVDVSGKNVLAPNYKALYFWNNGFVRVEGPKGAGLWKDGRMLAEPQFAGVEILGNEKDVYLTMDKDTVTYYSISKRTSHTLRKGAQYLRDGYVLGQDTQTGLYGIVEIGGKTVVPFAYPKVEGPPAAQVLVRADGKKGLIPGWNKPMREPEFWFDSYTTLGSYSMLSIKDGNRIGLYSESKGLIFPPQENTVISYDSSTNQVLVRTADGKTTAYGFDGEIKGDSAPPREEVLSERLKSTGTPGTGYVLVDRQTGETISKAYRSIYMERGGSKLIVGIGAKVADLYSETGELLTKDIQIPLVLDSPYQLPLSFTTIDNVTYTAGSKAGSDELALVMIAGGQIQPVSDFAYKTVLPRSTSGHVIFMLTRPDGSSDVWAKMNGQMARQLEGISELVTPEGLDRLFVRQGTGWDVYSVEGKRLTNGGYRSLKTLNPGDGKLIAIACQDAKSGLYGLLGTDGNVLTAPRYENLYSSKSVFPQIWNEAGQPPYLFTAGQQFGYLGGDGKELFRTAFLTKSPSVTYRPMTAQAFSAYPFLVRQNALELIALDKPYSWQVGIDSKRQFFANLALYLGLPKEAGKEEVLAYLVSKGIIKEDANRTIMSENDLYALCYYMETGQASQMTSLDLLRWANSRGLVRGKNPEPIMDLYAYYHELFFRELLHTPAGKKAAQPKKLSAAALTAAQKQMLTSMILVGRKPVEQLPLPLPQDTMAKALQTLTDQYNKQAKQLLAVYLAQN